jgi:hypothetical protein
LSEAYLARIGQRLAAEPAEFQRLAARHRLAAQTCGVRQPDGMLPRVEGLASQTPGKVLDDRDRIARCLTLHFRAESLEHLTMHGAANRLVAQDPATDGHPSGTLMRRPPADEPDFDSAPHLTYREHVGTRDWHRVLDPAPILFGQPAS